MWWSCWGSSSTIHLPSLLLTSLRRSRHVGMDKENLPSDYDSTEITAFADTTRIYFFDLLFLRISFWTSAFTVSKGSPLLNCLHLQLYFLLSHFIFCSFMFFILYFLSFICVPSMLPKTNWASLHFGNRTCMTSTTAFDVLEKSRNFLPLLYACLLIFTCIYCVHWGQCII